MEGSFYYSDEREGELEYCMLSVFLSCISVKRHGVRVCRSPKYIVEVQSFVV